MSEISPAQAVANDGVTTRHDEMDNGERRFRLRTEDGNGYILTRSPLGGWQNSHSHARVSETYVVERGCMLLAVKGSSDEEVPELTWLQPGQLVTTPVGRVHNVYLAPGSEIHTVKHGARGGEYDWVPDTDFDAVVRGLSIDRA